MTAMRALTRVPPDGRVVHLQGTMAAELLPELQRGAAPHPGPVCDIPEPPGTITSGLTIVAGRRVIWRAVVQGDRPIKWVLRDIAKRNGHEPAQVIHWKSILAAEVP